MTGAAVVVAVVLATGAALAWMVRRAERRICARLDWLIRAAGMAHPEAGAGEDAGEAPERGNGSGNGHDADLAASLAALAGMRAERESGS